MDYNVSSNLEPYNGIWLDCFQNNLMSILISYDSNFEMLPATIKFEYWKKNISQKFDSQATYNSLLEQGLFIPKIIYQTDTIEAFFDIQKGIFQNNDVNEIHELICNAFSESKFIFLNVDRFFYPSGREAGKFHFVHPIFLYGYSVEDGTYSAIEDCLSPGQMHTYEIPKEAVIASTKHLLQEGKEVVFRKVTPLEEEIKNYRIDNYNLIVKEIKNKVLLSEVRYVKAHDLYYQVGITALEHYYEEFDEIIGRCEDVSIFALRTTSFVQNHKKNSHMLLRTIQDKASDIELIQFAEKSLELASEWEIFKNIIFRNMVSGRREKNDLRSRDKLRTIIELEYKLLQGT
ncbi:hypothetical protein [Paenibacillus sp. PAMC 26794]|uniref:hypothetical protein n=1 Tax=Paenibacillus sp. PAMC 26794 TaxID=1257080 RepID=UPI0003080988|nr:hypothetical protein [Paenibacillus sp. PAMC 26794]